MGYKFEKIQWREQLVCKKIKDKILTDFREANAVLRLLCVWMYFIIFTAFISFAYLAVSVFLSGKLLSVLPKIRDIEQSARTITNNFDSEDMENITQRLAFENGLCISYS